MQAVINYCLNKFCPYIVIGVLLFINFDPSSWEPYIILGMILWIEKFHFKTGYSVAYCEARGITPYENSND
jgi:hypothetical protein